MKKQCPCASTAQCYAMTLSVPVLQNPLLLSWKRSANSFLKNKKYFRRLSKSFQPLLGNKWIRWGTAQTSFGFTSSHTLIKYVFFFSCFTRSAKSNKHTHEKTVMSQDENKTLRSLLDFVLDSCVTATCQFLNFSCITSNTYQFLLNML